MYGSGSGAVDPGGVEFNLQEWFAERQRTLGVLAIVVLLATLLVASATAEADEPEGDTYHGTVVAQDGGAPLSGIRVSIFCSSACDEYPAADLETDPDRPWPAPSLNFYYFNPEVAPPAGGDAQSPTIPASLIGEATTDSSGDWTLTVPDGAADVFYFWDPAGTYGMHLHKRWWSDASEGGELALSQGGRLSGTITGDSGVPPGAGFTLAASGYIPIVLRLDVGTDGSYATPVLPDGTYYIGYPLDLPEPYVSGVDYSLGTVTRGEDTESNHHLYEYVSLSGRVTDGSGNGLEGIRVESRSFIQNPSVVGRSLPSFRARVISASGVGRFTDFDLLTDSDGNYTVDTAIPGDVFSVRFSSPSGEYATQYFDDKTSADYNDGRSDYVAIPMQGDVSGIDAQLRPGSTVSGTVIQVSEENGARTPRPNTLVFLCVDFRCEYSRSNSAGFFKFSGLNAATYSLGAYGSGSPETTVELAEGTERYFVVVLDGDNSEINEPQNDASDTFEDIADGEHHEQAVAWMIRHGITTGCNREPALFCPDSDLTRAQFVTFLWRASGKPEASKAGSEVFGDVAAGHFADQAIGWAKEADVTTGCAQATETTEARFCIDSPVTRGQIATFLHRFVEEPESTFDHGFTDVDQGRYFSEAVAWTAEHMFVDGCSNTRFCPDENADRATAAVFIHGVATNPDSWASRTSDFQYG